MIVVGTELSGWSVVGWSGLEAAARERRRLRWWQPGGLLAWSQRWLMKVCLATDNEGEVGET